MIRLGLIKNYSDLWLCKQEENNGRETELY